MKLNSKTVDVTGAAKVISSELTLQLIANGANVAIVDLDEKALEETRNLAGNAVSRINLPQLNISIQESVAQLPDAVIAANLKVSNFFPGRRSYQYCSQLRY